MRLSDFYGQYEALSENDILKRMAKIDHRRGLRYTASTHHTFRVVLENGWIPEVGIIYESNSDDHHKVRISVNGFDQKIERHTDTEITIERIATAMCRCFLMAYDDWESRKRKA